MVVGILTVTLRLEGNASLKGKRKVVKSVLGRVRARFNVSASEVAEQDVHQLAVLGFTAAGPDYRLINAVMDNVLGFIEAHAEAEIIDSQLALEHFFT